MIFDLDGTLFRGLAPIEGAVEADHWLRDHGVMVRYLTNNSGSTIGELAAKLQGMGFPASPNEIMSSGLGAAKRLLADGKRRVHVVGEKGLVDTLEANGIVVADEQPDAVLVGICRTFTYDKLSAAMQPIRAGTPFYATNRDATYPLEGDRFIPGAGSIVAAVETASGVTPILIGKPEPALVQQLMSDAGVRPEETLAIGDRVDTDLQSARAAGCHALLVLTGVTPAPVEGFASLPSVADLPAAWASLESRL